jgi:hypothetical protein
MVRPDPLPRPPEQQDGNVQLRIRHDSDGSPVLALFKATIPYHCDTRKSGGSITATTRTRREPR